jgi:hypothetical protein
MVGSGFALGRVASLARAEGAWGLVGGLWAEFGGGAGSGRLGLTH